MMMVRNGLHMSTVHFSPNWRSCKERTDLRTIVRLDKIMAKTPKVIEFVQNRGQSRTQYA